MLRSAVPPSFPIAFASSAGGGFIRAIPTASQIGIQNGAASLTDGFPPLNFQPVAAGGVPPFGEDMNGLLNQITKWNQWQEAGGPIVYDATFQTAIGGYPQGAIVQSAVTPGKLWMSSVDNNTTNPDTISTSGWQTPTGMLPSGTPVASFSSTPPPGTVTANGLTIGNASSGANTASGTLLFVFCAVWLEFSNSVCSLLNSSGTPVARGANPFADFAANCRLTLPKLQGSALIGVDTMSGVATSLLNGVPVTSGGTTTPGSVLGENLTPLVANQLPFITSANTSPYAISASGSTQSNVDIGISGSTTGGGSIGINSVTSSGAASVSISGSVGTGVGQVVSNNTGGNTPAGHNTVPNSYTVYWNLAL